MTHVRVNSAARPQPRGGTLANRLERALQCHRRGQIDRARALYEEILRIDPAHFDALHLLGVIEAQSHRPAQAARLITRALSVDPRHPHAFAAHGNLALACRQMDNLRAALEHLDRALALKPDFAEALNNRGSVLQDLGQFEAALASHDAAIAANPTDPVAQYNRGNALFYLGRFAEALPAYESTLARSPAHPGANVGRGNVLREFGRFEEAMANYERALTLDPRCAEAHLGRATLWLRDGLWDEGWPEFEWRFRTAQAAVRVAPPRDFGRPRWDGGANVAGKRLLLHAEQGLGDTIQFCRYAGPVGALGATPVLEVQPSLVSLLARSFPGTEVIESGAALPPFDYHCSLLSAPRACNTRPTTIPYPTAYLRSDPQLRDRWQAMLAAGGGPRVGLAWRGNSHQTRDAVRSIGLPDLLRHLPSGPRYIVLQKNLDAAERELIAARADIANVADSLGDFDATAALCDVLDLVITVDTSVAHLAGALGRPTWLMLPWAADWRWLRERTDTPWYRTMRLYRQRRLDDWTWVLGRVAADLAAGEAEDFASDLAADR